MQEKKIATFAFLSIEATGIQSHEYKPRASELCIAAIERQHLIAKPRITNKIRLHLNPKKSNSGPKTIDDQMSMNEEFVQLVLLFLQRLPQPVCLIAHNGNSFDFRLLQAEIKSIGCNLPDAILCADSHSAFQSILPHVMTANGGRRNIITSTKSAVDEDEVEVIAIKDEMNDSPVDLQHKQNGGGDFQVIDLTEDSEDSTTDESDDSNIIIEAADKSDEKCAESGENEPDLGENSKPSDENCEKAQLNGFAGAAKRALEDSEELETAKKSKSESKSLHDCSLSALHEGLTGRELEKEYFDAEIGVDALVRVVEAAANPFCEWTDMNAVSVNTIQSFW